MSALSPDINLTPQLKVSRIMGGLWQVADQERLGQAPSVNQAASLLTQYVNKGISSFDLADHYGSSELIAGAYSSSDASATFCTKWVPTPGPASRKQVREAVEQSLQRMNSSSIALLQYHAWNYADPVWLDHLFWLQELKEEGLIQNLGVTNFDTDHLRIALQSGIELVSNQVSYSLLDQRAATAMSPLCQEFSVKLLAFGTLAGGFLSEKWLHKEEPKQLETWSQMKYQRFIQSAGGWAKFQQVLAQLSQLAEQKKCSVAQIAARYILDDPQVAAVIVGIRLGERDHSDQNVAILTLPWTEADHKLVSKIISEFAPISGDCGDEYRKPPFLTASGDLSHHIDKLPPPYQVVEDKGIRKIFSGTEWESLAGYCRAMQKGQRILISGTTATHGERAIGGDDPIAQTHFVLDKIEGTLQSLGASMQQVVRTRIYVRNIDHWPAVARVHGQRFAEIQPANTLVKADLVGDEYLVEIEAEALVD